MFAALKEYVTATLTQMPPGFRREMEKFGGGRVEGITICRVPLNEYLFALLGAVTVETGIVYHLFQVIQTEGGHHHIIRADKNEQVVLQELSLQQKNDLFSTLELSDSVMAVGGLRTSVDWPFTLREYFERAERTEGPPLFLYDAGTSNCQHFTMRCLAGSGLLTDALGSFVTNDAANQMTASLMSKPVLQMTASVITSLASLGGTLKDNILSMF